MTAEQQHRGNGDRGPVPQKDTSMTTTAAPTIAALNGARKPRRTLRSVNLATVEVRRIEWFWKGYVPIGMATVIAGPPKAGKSSVGISLAAATLTDGLMADGSRGAVGQVMWVLPEDPVAEVLKPRLMAAGVRDFDRFHVIEGASDERDLADPYDEGHRELLWSDLALMGAMLDEARAAGDPYSLVWIDAVNDLLATKADSLDKERDVRPLWRDLATFAARHRVALVGNRHHNKATGKSAMERQSGSTGHVAVTRSILQCVPDPTAGEGEPYFVFSLVDSNIGPPRTSLSYRMESAEVPAVDGIAEVGILKWQGPSALTADGALGVREKNKSDEAREWLLTVLPPNSGLWAWADELKAAWEADGNGLSWDSVSRVAKTAGVVKEQRGAAVNGGPQRSQWHSPTSLGGEVYEAAPDEESTWRRGSV